MMNLSFSMRPSRRSLVEERQVLIIFQAREGRKGQTTAYQWQASSITCFKSSIVAYKAKGFLPGHGHVFSLVLESCYLHCADMGPHPDTPNNSRTDPDHNKDSFLVDLFAF